MLLGILRLYVFFPTLVGLGAGLLVLLFITTLNAVSDLVLGRLLGIRIPQPPGLNGGGEATLSLPELAYLLPLVMAGGALLSEILVQLVAPEAHGMSGDAVVQAYHRRKRLSLKTSLVKLIASAVVIGTGGPVGRLSPSALIGAGIADSLSKIFRLSATERRILIAVGFGAGLSAVLKAPLAGAIMSSEVFFRRDFEAQALLPSFIASVVSYSVFGTVFGFEPLFHVSVTPFSERGFSDIPLFVGLALVCTLVVKLFIRFFLFTRKRMERLFPSPYLRVFIGGLSAGGVCYLFPVATGGGLGWVQTVLDGKHDDYSLLVGGFLGVLLGMSLLLGSGASGGIFGPSLVMGGFLGALYGTALEKLLGLDNLDIPSLVVVGMVSFLAGVANAPLANIILVSEVTGGYELLVPSMISVFITYLLTSRETVYPSQLDTRFDSPAYRSDLGMFVLERLKVRDYMSTPLTVAPEDSVRYAHSLLEKNLIGGLPVVVGDYLVGIVTRSDVLKVSEEERERKRVGEVMSKDLEVVTPDETLSEALKLMVGRGVGRLPVVERKGSRKLVGIIARADIGRAIRENLP